MAEQIIQEGDQVVLDVNGEKLTFVQKLKGASTVRVGKYTVPAAPLIGAPYGSVFEVTADGKNLQRVLVPPPDEVTRITETEKDNSSLFDRNTENQKLTHDQIEELKRSGKAGTEIIAALCSNSATFQNKTEFSQDKYKRRKAKKYLTYLTVRQPTARVVCEAFYDKSTERVWNLRHDSLAVMLSLANVTAGAKVLVVDHCLGVVTAGAVERLGGVGSVCAAQLDHRPASLDAVRMMNVDAVQRATLFSAPLATLVQDRAEAVRGGTKPAAPATPAATPKPAATGAAAGAAATPAAPDAGAQQDQAAAAEGHEGQGAEAAAAVQADAGAKPEAMEVDAGAGAGAAAAEEASPAAAEGEKGEQKEAGAGTEAATAAAPATEGKEQGKGKGAPAAAALRGAGGWSFAATQEALATVAAAGFDSCLLAYPKVHPTALLDAVWPLLAPSATFAVFSPWPQPLAEAFSALQTSRNAVMLQLQESWLRPYQVLPSRTHPHMTCTGTGGFVLSGIKVVSPDATPLGAQLARAQSGAAGGQQGQGEGEEEAGAGAQRGGGGGGGGWGRRGEDKEAAAGGEEGDRRQSSGGGWGRGRGGDGGGRGGRGGGRNGGGGGGGWGGNGGGWGRGGRGRDGGNGGGRGWGRDRDGGGRGDRGGRGGGGGWGGGGGKRRAESNGASPAAKKQAQ